MSNDVVNGPALVHELFRERARRTPDALAVDSRGGALTYGELEARSNRLAHHLRSLGVGPEVRVAVCAGRTPERLVGLLAVLKAGGAYLSLDPEHPAERLAFQLEDARVPVVLTQEPWAGRLPAAIPTIDLDRIDELPGSEERPPAVRVDPSHLAYVIYTSGSTGKPKGVEIPHAGLLNLVRWHQGFYEVTPEDRATLVANPAFDASVWEIWPYLTAGASLHIPDEETRVSPPALAAWWAERGITLSFLPTPLAEAVMEAVPDLGPGSRLRALIVGGDRLHRRPAPGAGFLLVNHYGPSEYSVVTTAEPVPPDPEAEGLPPIGRAIDNTRVYVLGSEGEPAAAGEAGELYVAGIGLARGYLGRPDLTAERFVPDPWSPEPGGRMYRTGDLVRSLPDGRLDFLGRIDHQVKIRGFRVELGEIEAALGSHPAIADNAVTATEMEGGREKVLVAYVVPRPGMALPIPELRGYLGERLAEYMVPAHFVVMEALPLTPNGKVDRKALPRPDLSGERQGAVAPRTPLEAVLAEIWSEVLGIPGIGVGEHFFELGGHSLLAARVAARIQESLGRRLTPRALFEEPTIERLAARLAGLPAGQETGEIPAAAVSADGRWVPSSGQEAMWFFDRLSPGAPVYTIPLLWDLEGPLDVAALQRALAEVVRRHEVLRVAFSEAAGRPVLAPADVAVGLRRIDLRSLPEAAREREAGRAAEALASRPVDLGAPPLLRATLIERSGTDHRLLLSLHHVVGDDWSTWVLAHDLAAAYARPEALPPLPVQYLDYALWQREWLRGEEAREQLSYWRRHLEGAPDTLDLPADRPRPAAQSFAGGRITAAVPASDTRALVEVALRGGGTLFMAALAVLETLFHRYSGQTDLCVGVQAANRHRSGTQGLVGLFTNTLVLRADLRGNPGFRALLAQARETVLAGMDRQDLPFDSLVRELLPDHRGDRFPLTQAVLVFQNVPAPPRHLGPGLGLRLHELGNDTAKLDLALYLREEEGGLTGVWEYASSLFDAATIARMAGHFGTLLAAAAASPDLPVGELDLLTGPERRQLLAWNQTATGPRGTALVHELFSERAREAPSALAVSSRRGLLTYGELEARSNRLAHHLRSLGVGPEIRVAICIGRTPERVIGILAVLKAGGAYLSLDPEHPTERLAFQLEDARVPVILTQGESAGRLPPSGAATIDLDRLGDLAGAEDRPPAVRVHPEGLAYVIYTSGSTGVPKGVEVPHAGLLNLVRWHQDCYAVTAADRATLVANPAFDASVWELWPYLAAGASSHIPDEETRVSPEALAAWWEEQGITLSFLPTPLAEAVLDALPAGARLPLRALIAGGDRLDRRPAPGAGFLLGNHYGPSEYSVVTTAGPVAPAGQGLPSIGRPIDNTRVHVLGPGGQPVPAGVPGELCVAGVGLARGYLGRPDLTAERFVPDPWSPEPGGRMYRTGDQVRWRPDGEIDFLGRLDLQVKIRGLRIELGEIEAALRRHPAVRDAAVLMRDDRSRGQRLAAWVVPSADLGAPELRDFLGGHLPDYMVPAVFSFLEALPLSSNGKVDRKALASAPLGEAPAEAEGVAPRTPVEEGIAGIWRDLLGAGAFGVHADFFELGGHSLLATQALSQVRALFGVEIPLRQLFEQPTVAGLARRVEEALRAGYGPAVAPITPAPRTGPLPVSFPQQRLWFLDRMAPGSTAYNVPLAFRVRAALDADLLERALSAVVRRHEVLRTTFLDVEGEPRQVVHPEAEVALARTDLTAATEEEALRRIAEEAERPFDLAAGPLLRAALWSLAAEDHFLLIAVHHIVFDGWSLGPLLKDLADAYEGLLAGGEARLAPLPIQYADFALWQQRELVGRLGDQLAYWKRQLAGARQVLDLPGDHPRPAAQSFRGGLLTVDLPAELTRSVHDLAHQRRATPFMLLLAAFEALLERYSGQPDFLIGTPVANRSRPETEELVGFFVNTLVLRADLSGDPSFTDLLGRTREAALDAYAAQDLPFERLVEELKPERDAAWSPLFQVMLVLQSSLAAPAGSPRLPLQPLDLGGRGAKFDLTLLFEERGDELSATFEYAADLFEPATIQRMAEHLRTLLAGAVAEPAHRLSELPLLAREEREQILRWSAAPGPRPRGLTLQSLFAAQAARTPERTAVLAEDGALTYAELDDRSGRLARHLRRLGVGADTLVGLCLERSLEMVVAVLGVLKAGGAYVPLDPEYPAERLALMVEDSGIRVVLTQRKLRSALPQGPESVLCLDTDWPAISALPPLAAGTAGGEESLAYVIFTSGSTGRPKGAAIPQRAIVNHMLWMQEAYPLEPGDRVLQKTPFSFDASVWEFYAPLLAGATLVMAVPGGQREPSYLADVIQSHGITIFQAVPPLLRAMLDYGRMGECRSLRRVFCGGEALTADIQRDFFATLDAELVNLYGPTETTIEILSWRCDPVRSDRPALLGWPVTNAEVHVLDPHGEICPVGVPGEICAGGVQVGRGYLDRPAETALRFVPDPFAAGAGGRLYRTGDLGRRLPGGTLEFLGRIDHQVKVRGFRIELGEIESALASHPEVSEAAVLVDGQRLSAWVALRSPVAVADLRGFLGERLPDYMVPSSWTLLEALPHTPSGKVDRRALAALRPAGEERAAGEGPRDAVEKAMLEAWAELGLAVSGIHDDFFELGGHSLLATRLVSRIRRIFGIEIAVRQVFATPTVAGLAAAVREALESGGATATLMGRSRATGERPLSYAQRRLWFLEQLDPGLPVYNLPVLLRVQGPLDAGVLDRALVEIVRRHEALRTTFYALGGEPFQKVAAARSTWLGQVDLTGLPEDRRAAEAGRQALAAAVAPFDLGAGPLLRAVLLRSGAGESLLALVIHHIATDGWSTGILLRELFTLYGAFAAGGPSPLADLPLQYADFARWQREWLEGEALAAELEHWRCRLEGAPRLLELPADRPRPAARSTRGRLFHFELPESLARAVRERAREWGVTPFMLLLAAFEALLGRYSGQESLLVGTPVAGRNRAEIEGLIGFFVNTLVLRADLGDDPGFRELVARTREAALDAQTHQDLPFEKLVEDLQPERSLSHTPLFQVMFAYEGDAPESEAPAGLTAELVEPEFQSAKFDLTLNLIEDRDRLRGALEYATDLFDEPTMARLARHFETLLAGALAGPELRLSELPMLGPGEELPLPRRSPVTPPSAVSRPRPDEDRPSTPTEDRLAAVWAGLLQLRRVGLHDNFFELGGHSLLAIQVVSRVREAFGVELPVRLLFESPTVAGLARLVDAARATAAAQRPIERVGRDVPLPLSYAQRRLWFLEQLDPGLPVYNLPVLLRLRGPLDTGVLDRALVEIVRRHEALRTTFYALGGEPFQKVAAARSTWLGRVDLTGLPEDRRAAESGRQALAAAVAPFDLGAGPLLRAVLLRSEAGESALALVIHHIATDGWSTGILLRELFTLYGAFAAGEPSPLADLPLQYADFAHWQQEWLEGEALAVELDHWRRRLEGAPRLLELPSDRPRPAARSTRGRLVHFELPESLARAVRERAREWGATPFMLLLAAFEALLGRYSGQDCLLVGTPVAGRNRAEIEGLIGFFINTLVLRADLGDDPGFRELVARAREAALDAQTHQDLPFEKLVEDLQPERSLSHTPLFQVMLAYDGPAPEPEPPAGLTVELLESELHSAKFDLTLFLTEDREGLRGALEYATDLFDEPTMARLATHFEILLAGALQRPGPPLSELPLLSVSEERQLLVDWNGGRGSSALVPVHELFARQAARTPDAPALRYEEEALSFRELDARAEALARRLAALGIGPESPVALCLDRSLAMIVAILGVMKAGGAYVPLDPEAPRERLALVLEDCGARALLTQEALAGSLPPFSGPVIRMTAGGLVPGAEPGLVHREPAGLENLAYVIYTSGSTGRPKGVMVGHGQLASYLAGVLERMALPEGMGYATVSTLAADLGNTVVFAALATGGCLHVISRARLSEGPALAEYCARHPVDCLKIVPSHLAALLGDPRGAGSLPRRLLVLGGEAASPALVERVRELAPGCRVLNHYGPTETTVGVLTHEIRSDGRVPLGRPLAGARVLVLDRALHLTPAGVPGELYVGGPQVSRGYLGRPDLTAERFRPDPWGEPGARLYATGDRGRHLPDGAIEFLGRVDFQIKVRGYRVEPGEIEAALRACPGVAAAVVVARDQGLVSYVVAEPPAAPEAAALRAFLRERLPDPLVPSAWVFLPALPLTPNGKVDRAALPSPEGSLSLPEGGHQPETPAEAQMASIWAGVLGLRQVGSHDDFFELGGHSLLAVQVVSRVRDSFGAELPVRLLFENPTVAGLARLVDAARTTDASRRPIERVGRDIPLPLSFAQRRLWLLDRLSPGSAVYNISYPLSLTGALDPGALRQALAGVVRRHEVLRTTFPETAGEPFQQIAPAGVFSLPVVDLGVLPEPARSAEAAALAAREGARPFDLGAGPLFRATLLRLEEERHLLLLGMHHIVSDGWSTGILLRDLAALYEGGSLPDLPVQYADFAVWERQWLSGEVLASQLDYWRRQLAGAPAGLDLPTDFPRPAIQTFNGASCSTELPLEDLKAFCRREGVTPFMLLLAGFDVLLSRYSGQEDIVVGSPVANRSRQEVEGLVGFFVNTLVLRLDLGTAVSLQDLLCQARETALAAFTHQALPFEVLVEELKPERDLSRSPFFQVLLAVQNAGEELPSMGDLRLDLAGGDSGTSKFDLSLFASETGAGLTLGVEYNTDLYEGSTIQRLLGHLGRLLAAAMESPGQGWRDLPLLTAEEREQLLVTFNDTGSTEGPDVCLHQLFEAMVERMPDRTALIAPDARLTYRELDARAERLAKRLRSLGLGPERLAGVLLDRTADLIVALLAIQKAGGAYAPLDPNYPKQRMRLMLETARATVLVTRRHLAEDLPAEMTTVFLEPGWEQETAEAELPAVLPENLAYVIFTSGSTGAPKGVAIQHRSAVAMVRWCLGMYSPEEYAGVLVSTSICFDMSVFEIFATLAAGGRLILAENALALPELAAKDEVVLVDTVPSAMAELLRSGRLPSTIRTVNLGGEPLKASLVREIYEQLPSVERVVNLYGPSEDTTFTSWAVVPRDTDHPLIGRALTGEQAYVLDREMRPVPIGVPGALYMGGEGVTRGYLHRPDLTAERYVPNPYGPPGSRLYTVGDLVRYLPTGELDYLGRLDHQVKVRGFRIELGEIEATLTRHPEVREAAVLATPDVLSGNRLLAFLETERDLPVADLRVHLKQTLPDYMVPSIFVQLRELPLTPNGKIDRRALAALPFATESVEEGRGPRGYAEEVLVGLWSDLFGRAVGVEENFFDLGGHSLLATRLASRIREAFGIELALRRIFEQPTIAGLARSVEAALGVGGALEATRIEPVPRTGPLPLSFAQRRLWFLDQLSPGSAVYNIPAPLGLEGPLEIGRLAAALTALVARHESLRTTFPSVDGEPVQAIAPPGPFPLPVVDLDGLPAAAALIRQESLRPFDLGTGPLFRATLLRLGAERHILLLNMHHIVSDGWSIEILLRELSALYEDRPLPPLPVQYADFAVWQRQWLSGEALSRQLDYWRVQLAGAPAGLDLPTDFPRPAVQTFHGATRSAELPAEDLRAFCRREGVTLFMLLLAGFDALLSRYSGQEDVLVGSPVAGRNRAETEGLIGFFVNTLVLRIDLGAAVSFRDLLRQARETALGAYGHQDLPFETLVEELKPQRDLSRSPFFQVLLSLQTLAGELPALSGVRVSGVEGAHDSAKFDLSLFAADTASGLGMTAEYNTDLYEGATVQRLLGHLGRLLAAAVSDPGQGWRDLPLLTGEEREQLLVTFNDTGATAGPDVCLHQLFEAAAAQIPERVALIASDARLTYRELDARAERLARRLRSLGLGPERLAGVLMDRTADLIVALLAIQKAGGAYAPLDPNYPKQRVQLMLETARATVLVTRRHLIEGLPEGMRTVFLDPGWESEPVEAELPEVLPENLAYVIFTSGSTGAPKGVAIQHRSAVSMVRWCLGMYSPEEYSGVLVSTSICFDMSVFEIFATLAAGGRLILAENALALPELAAKDEVVLVDTVPSAMAELLRTGRLPSTIRTVNLGGEPLKASLVQEIYEQLPSVERVVNLYGPSEDTTFTSYAVVPRDTDHPLIGRGLTGEQAYVLDREMRPVPVGVPGALYMGGEGVTRGYLHRPDLTAERYVPNPYGPPGSRLYTVGDLVRYLPTGELDYLGRLDHQVKVRGFRVELGEIEATLTRHPQVREAAVLATPDMLGGTRLLAYVETERDLPVADLRAHLKQSLPDYMVPSIFVQLRELPLTPNGKIDRRALAALPLATESTEEGRGPRGYAEEVLAGIWSDLFGRVVGVEENFFDLGGHSLLATRVISRIREAFGIELPLRLLFEQPTIAGLARSVEAALGVGGALEAPRIEPVPRTGPLPLSFAQRRLWFLDQLSPGSAVYNIPAPLDLEGPLETGRLAAALTALVARHEALRTTFPSLDGEPVQAIVPAGPFPLPVVDLDGLPEAAALIRQESLRPFDLGTGPLFRATLLRLGAERHILLLNMHHVVSDGWSTEILLRELSALYEGRPLPELPVQYADFAVWQRQWLSGEALSRQLDYWRVQLAGASAGLDLPTDFPRPAVQTFHGATRSAELPAEDLRAFCRREGVTLFMLLLAGFDALLSRYSGQEDVLVGSPVAGRNRAETEGLIGFFVNTLVLRVNLGEAASFRDLLRQARETALAAYGHQDLPFETLVEELKPQRDLSRSPFFQVLLSLQTLAGELPALGGVRVSGVHGAHDSAKFDLSLFVSDAAPGLGMTAEYNTDLYEGATVQRLLGHLGRLLAAAVSDPGQSWRDLPLLTGEEREQLLVTFNDTGATAGPGVCLHQLFEEAAARVPEQVALIAPDARLTYRELDARAERLAKRLRSLGLGPERLAGVLLDRTADLIVALLAIQKAGGAYAPLDPNYPKQRVQLMLETARATVLVTRRHLAEDLPTGMQTVFLDPGWESEPAEAELPQVLPENLAYVIFTSGSTGVPKGVAIQHRSAVSMVRWCLGMYSPEEYAGVLVSTSICFDMSVFEIFATLAAGGRLILAENALALPELAAKDEVVLVDTVPSAMAELLRSGRLPSTIRTVNLGGEPLKASLVREIYEQLPSVERVVNLYGPSEDTTFTSWAVVPCDTDHPLIGWALTGEQAYVLDREMRPVPIGVPGALYMGGEGVTRGYLHRPDLTAERYVPNPYGPPGSRLYTVGDLVRYLPTGELDYLGRLDHQVKVRGFRIELGEIEATLTRHPEVREAAVLATPDVLGGNRLLAFLETERELPMADLRAHLKQTLPDYMIPSIFVQLRELPLTPNGKIDRRSLAALPVAAESPEEKGRAPRGYVEEVLAGIWSDVFGRPVGVEESFFDLGGHSLLATRVVSRIRVALNVELPLQQIFSAPTVEGLAAFIEREIAEKRAVPLSPIGRAAREGFLPLSFGQQRLWFLDRLEPGTATFNLPSPLRLRGRLDPGALSRALDEIVRRHESLRTVFGEHEGRGYQKVQPPAPVPLPLVDLSGLPEPARENEARRQAEQEARRPFDLARGPLFRAVLVKLEARDGLLLVTLHHIVTDGLSTALFARELRTLYAAFAAGLPSSLPELPLQYPDFAVWQREVLGGPAVEALLEDWTRRFGTAAPSLDLPTDRPRPPVQTFPGALRTLRIDPETSRQVRRLAQRSGVTLFMALLGAFQALLHRWSGQERILVGSPVAGRNHPELEGMIGFFVNTLVFPSDLSDGLTVARLLERSRETALGVYASQDLPFERLVETLQPVRDNSRSPVFQAMFLMHHEPPAVAETGEGGIRFEPYGAGTGTSQFDLTLFAADGPEGILTGVEYNTDLFDTATLDRFLEQYRDLLAAAAGNPEARLAEILPAAPERRTEEPAAAPEWKPASSAAVEERRDRLSSRLSRLSPAQREALQKRLKGGGAS